MNIDCSCEPALVTAPDEAVASILRAASQGVRQDRWIGHLVGPLGMPVSWRDFAGKSSDASFDGLRLRAWKRGVAIVVRRRATGTLVWTATRVDAVTEDDLGRMVADGDPLAPGALVASAGLPVEATTEVMAVVHVLCSHGLNSSAPSRVVAMVAEVCCTEGAVEVLLGLSASWEGDAAGLVETSLRLCRRGRAASTVGRV